MSVGARIRIEREKCGLSQAKLADLIGVDNNTISRWERGLFKVAYEYAPKLSSVLNAPIHCFIDDTDGSFFAAVLRGGSDHIPGADYDLIKLPVLSIANVACAGNGFSLEYVEDDIEGYEYVSKADLGPIDENNKPYVIRVEGDSMEDAGIPDGARVAINPAATVNDGNPALVCYGLNKERAIKWVHWQTDGGVKIRSANPRYEPRIFTKEDIELGFFFVVGKVMQVITKPLNG